MLKLPRSQVRAQSALSVRAMAIHAVEVEVLASRSNVGWRSAGIARLASLGDQGSMTESPEEQPRQTRRAQPRVLQQVAAEQAFHVRSSHLDRCRLENGGRAKPSRDQRQEQYYGTLACVKSRDE
jgi:hypothetical protein